MMMVMMMARTGGADNDGEIIMARPGGATEIKHVPPAEHLTTSHGKLSLYSSRIYQKLLSIGKVLYLYLYLPRRNKHDCNTDGALQRKLQQINLTQNRWKSAQKFKTKFATNKLDSKNKTTNCRTCNTCDSNLQTGVKVCLSMCL